MSNPAPEPGSRPSTLAPGNRAGVTPVRLVAWILGAGFALFLIVIGVIGILTKAR
jgi:hypothetical protein